MYLIANSSRSEITISDLGISLNPRQAMDLHKIKSIDEINKSKNLKSAISSGSIKILHKDEVVSKEEKTEVIVQNQFDKEGLLKDIKELLAKEVDEKIKKVNDIQEKNNASQNDKLFVLLQAIQENLSKNSTPISEGKNQNIDIDDISISSDKIIEMHSKAIEKMSKNVETNIISPERKIEDKNVAKNADELDNLI
jgi:hypothetical protein